LVLYAISPCRLERGAAGTGWRATGAVLAPAAQVIASTAVSAAIGISLVTPFSVPAT
jgi:hypothetical protein